MKRIKITTMAMPCIIDILRNNKDSVIIQDSDEGMSITNAAEHVCGALNRLFPNRSIYYYDTEGQYDELVHEQGKFLYFRPGPRQ